MIKKKLPPTEYIENPEIHIDKLSDKKAYEVMLKSHSIGINAIKNVLPNIEKAVSKIFNRLKNCNGRIIYVGAGTSGRVAVQDGSELYPTFGWPISRVEFIIAGGKKALIRSIENAEDDIKDAKQQVKNLNVSKKDIIIGLAASGNTPFTCKVLEESKKLKALTIGISNNITGKLLKFSDHKIVINSGGEVIAGSTRLKSATSQKVCLNLISTMLMIKFGNIKNGMMVNLIATNSKLKIRKKNILENIN